MNKSLRAFFFCLFTVAVFAADASSWELSSIVAEGLRCEYQVDPLGIDVDKPRLSWTLKSNIRGQKQTAYQVIVSTNLEKLKANRPDQWDSQKVLSSNSIQVIYQGRKLTSGTRYYWKVRVWDKDGNPGDWSEPSWFETALLNQNDWDAKWINDAKRNPVTDDDLYKFDPGPLFRKDFVLVKPVKQARLYITGLGYYEASINGDRIGDHLLDPGWTDYSKRVYYSTYDVTDQLQDGSNCLGVMLGNGWYNPLPLRMWGHRNIRETLTVGRPRFISQLDIIYEDCSTQSIISDENWKVTEGPILRNSIYLGEIYDARKEISGWNKPGFDDSTWSNASQADESIGELVAQPLLPIRMTATVKPTKITEPLKNVYIVDMGQNFAGLASFKFDLKKGTQVNLRYGELLHKDGTLNPMTSVCGQIKGKRNDSLESHPGIAWQSDVYIAGGNGPEIYMPSFTFHAFRYIEITGCPVKPTLDMVTGLRLNSDVKQVGDFSCSNEMFNSIQKMCQWTFLSNIFSVQSDCPHRERFGYGGDLVNTSDAFMLNYDMANFYVKAVYDWADAARDDGMLTDTAPFVGIQYCGLAWAMTHPHLQLELYQYYGDRRILEEQYGVSRKWFEIIIKQTPDHIVKDGLSDHEGLEDAPAPVMVTPLYCETARIMSQIAGILGRKEDERRYGELASQIKSSYAGKFIDGDTGKVGPGSQASQAFALSLDMIDDEDTYGKALQFLLDDIKDNHDGHLSTGIFGTRLILDLLSEKGQMPIAYDIVNQRDFPGWGYMLDNGATTLWEHWAFSDNTFSHNHPMFGSVSQWFFNRLGGIQPAPESIGFDRIIIRPEIVEDLQWVKCRYDSVRGPIVSNWQKRDGNLYFDIEIPVNSQAEVFIPVQKGQKVLEANEPIENVDGIVSLRKENGKMLYKIGSGKYSFFVE
jgi:alpha-L-rhamnosidase